MKHWFGSGLECMLSLSFSRCVLYALRYSKKQCLFLSRGAHMIQQMSLCTAVCTPMPLCKAVWSGGRLWCGPRHSRAQFPKCDQAALDVPQAWDLGAPGPAKILSLIARGHWVSASLLSRCAGSPRGHPTYGTARLSAGERAQPPAAHPAAGRVLNVSMLPTNVLCL